MLKSSIQKQLYSGTYLLRKAYHSWKPQWNNSFRNNCQL